MLICQPRRHPSAGSAVEEADLEKVRFDYLFDRVFFLVKRSAKGAEADGAAVEFFDDGHQKLAVHFIEAECVDLHPIQRVVRDMFGYPAVMVDLGVIADAAEQSVGNARCAAGSAGYLVGAGCTDLDVQNSRRAFHDLLQFLDAVKIEVKDYPEPTAQR